MLKVENLVCGYRPTRPIVGPVSFHVHPGEIVCIVGPNGIGKTTLFKTILGLLKRQSGTIQVDGKELLEYSAKEFARVVAYVPQGHVPPFPYRVRDVVVMGCNPNMHELSAPRAADYETAERVLNEIGIAHLADRDYTKISGGERQMVMIGRALAQSAKLLVMDEPTAHLDYGNEARVLEEVKRLSERGYTIIMITHTPDHAFLYADQVLAVGRDQFFAAGAPEDVLTEERLKTLYGVNVQLSDIVLRDTQRKAKVCVPASVSDA